MEVVPRPDAVSGAADRAGLRRSGYRGIDGFPVNFPAVFVQNDNIEVFPVRLLLIPDELCQPLAVLDGSSATYKFKSLSIPDCDTVL